MGVVKIIIKMPPAINNFPVTLLPKFFLRLCLIIITHPLVLNVFLTMHNYIIRKLDYSCAYPVLLLNKISI